MSTITPNTNVAETTAVIETDVRLHKSRPSFFGLVRGELFKTVYQWTPWITLVLLAGILFLPFLLMFASSDLKSTVTEPGSLYFYSRVAATMSLLRAFGGISLLIVTAR